MTKRIPSVLTCLVTIAIMDVLAHAFGLRRTFSLLRRVAPPAPSAVCNQAFGEETARRITLAAAFYPRRALCLEQSLALFTLLRRRGIAAELRLGVQPRPFFAHAWVEIAGRPLIESADLPLNLAPFPSLGV